MSCSETPGWRVPCREVGPALSLHRSEGAPQASNLGSSLLGHPSSKAKTEPSMIWCKKIMFERNTSRDRYWVPLVNSSDMISMLVAAWSRGAPRGESHGRGHAVTGTTLHGRAGPELILFWGATTLFLKHNQEESPWPENTPSSLGGLKKHVTHKAKLRCTSGVCASQNSR